MIKLFGRDEYSLLGIAAMLDAEKIPYQRLAELRVDGDQLLLVAAADLSDAETSMLAQTPSIVFGGGPTFAERAFHAVGATMQTRAGVVSLDAPVWQSSTVRIARSFDKHVLRMPAVPTCAADRFSRGTVLAWLSESRQPAIVRSGPLVWSTMDLGTGFADLITERDAEGGESSPMPCAPAWVRGAIEAAYYGAPERWRDWVQGRAYDRLARRLQGRVYAASEYPIDATGWLLIELVKALIKLTAGRLIRLERWPAPYRSAATLTHDLEPRRFAYTAGLGRLLDRVATTKHPAAFGIVARAGERYLSTTMLPQLRAHTVMCHGLTHRGERVRGRTRVVRDLREARSRLEHQLQRPVSGYRSPRLDRSADLMWALDQQGFRYDSSCPDVDRENLHHYGSGVRLNLPFRPLLRDDSESYRLSRCLEMPLTAPDCIQPLFAGATREELRATVAGKAAFVRETGGVYVALVHGGVFGTADAARREDHLEFVHRQLSHPDVWLGGIEDIAEWWWARNAVQVSIADGFVRVVNAGARSVAGVRLVIETLDDERVCSIPTLRPGGGVTIAASGLPEAIAIPRARATQRRASL